MLSCFFGCTEETAVLPKGTELRLDAAPEITVLYDQAMIDGNVVFFGDKLDGHKSDMLKYLKVEIVWGTGENNLVNSVNAVNGVAEDKYHGVRVTYSAQLTGLDDGATYYFAVRANYGEKVSASGTPVHFFTLPQGPVDMDLKSGNMWSSCNLGAAFPHMEGNYYAWAETSPKESYEWNNYKYANKRSNRLTKYCVDPSHGDNGFSDGLTVLEPADDAAQSLGEQWHTPSEKDWLELVESCSFFSSSYNGINGYLVRSKSSLGDPKKVIFIPKKGYMANAVRNESWGFYWTSEIENKGDNNSIVAKRMRFFGAVPGPRFRLGDDGFLPFGQ